MTGLPVLAHQAEGSGAPLLLLNGGMMSFSAWDDFVPPLAERYRVVRCDLRGQLRSPGAQGAFEATQRTSFASSITSASGGATLPGRATERSRDFTWRPWRPERVASLVAMTVADHVSGEMWAEAREMAAACREALAGGPREKVYDLIAAFAFSPEWAAAHATEIAARRVLVAHLPDAWFEGLAGLLSALERLDVTALLPRISCPVLVLLAEGDRAMPRDGGEALAKGLPHGELAVVPGSGHALVVEKPRETVDSLLAFLARNPLPAEAPTPEPERDGGSS
ncbi:MAG: alpha/beta hydrolase [Holophagales bacterium]|nr:alpha/beta hydrolase [Holophagales bacterium]